MIPLATKNNRPATLIPAVQDEASASQPLRLVTQSQIPLVAPHLQAGILGFPEIKINRHSERSLRSEEFLFDLKPNRRHDKGTPACTPGFCSAGFHASPWVFRVGAAHRRAPCPRNPRVLPPLGFPTKQKNLSSRAQRRTCFSLPLYYRLRTPDSRLALGFLSCQRGRSFSSDITTNHTGLQPLRNTLHSDSTTTKKISLVPNKLQPLSASDLRSLRVKSLLVSPNPKKSFYQPTDAHFRNSQLQTPNYPDPQ
jgi:hypothetical protein